MTSVRLKNSGPHGSRSSLGGKLFRGGGGSRADKQPNELPSLHRPHSCRRHRTLPHYLVSSVLCVTAVSIANVAVGSFASYLGHAGRWLTSATPRKRTGQSIPICRDGPQPVMSGCSTIVAAASLLDHVVGPGQQRHRHVEAERLCGLQIDDQLVFRWRLHRKVGGLLALEDAIDAARGAPVRRRNYVDVAIIASPDRPSGGCGRPERPRIARWRS